MISDLGVLRPHPETNELQLVAVHPGISVEEVVGTTGWPLQVAEDLDVSDPPSKTELAVLRDLKTRTSAAHSQV